MIILVPQFLVSEAETFAEVSSHPSSDQYSWKAEQSLSTDYTGEALLYYSNMMKLRTICQYFLYLAYSEYQSSEEGELIPINFPLPPEPTPTTTEPSNQTIPTNQTIPANQTQLSNPTTSPPGLTPENNQTFMFLNNSGTCILSCSVSLDRSGGSIQTYRSALRMLFSTYLVS